MLSFNTNLFLNRSTLGFQIRPPQIMSFIETIVPRDIPRRRPSFASNLAHSVESWSSSYARSLHYMNDNLTRVSDDLSEDDVHHIVYGTSSSPSSSMTRTHPPNVNTAYTDEEGMPDEQSSLLKRKASIYSVQSRSSIWSSTTFDDQPKSTFAQSLINSVNILIGIALLSFPLALKNAGWILGAILLAFTCLLTNYTAKIIARCLDYPKATRELKTYADMAGAAYGMQGRIFISTVFMLELIAASVALIVLFADSLHILFPTVDTVTFKILAFIILTPTTYLAIRHLSYTSFVGILSSFTLVAVVCYDGATKTEHPGSLSDPMPTSLFPVHWMTLPLAFGQMAAGFAGHATFPSVYRDMAHPEDFNQVVNYTYLATSLIYAFMAASGYLMFGENVLVITENMMQTPGFNQVLNKLAVWLIVINPFTKYALTLSGVNFTIELSIFRHPSCANINKSKITMRLIQLISRLLVSSLVVLIAILFPAFDRVIVSVHRSNNFFDKNAFI
ncbi:hypothetical protein INT43_008176 [Umbelopsis isabellina]|uniref:Amino acid transporter transmembrane domain-containing protein n=1 Tax=Mortierella isabellina TaxID=91625 RepID=A0A8H7PED0_MORIS|nr:hypothetical protein INT43_008176 [Umbelopsis isabellina]